MDRCWWLGLSLVALASGYCIPSDAAAIVTLADAAGVAEQLNWNLTSDPCCVFNFEMQEFTSWEGVDCLPTDCQMPQHIDQINIMPGIASIYAGGYLPAEIGDFVHLTILMVCTVGLTGTIPPEIGLLSNLSQLTLSGNQLEGTIPDSIGGMVRLTELDLNNNQLSGDLSALSLLENVMTLDVSMNAFTGPFPNITSPRIISMSVADNQLTGTLPTDVIEVFSIAENIQVNSNLFTGTIPPQWLSMPTTQYVDISGNYLSGTIPPFNESVRLLTFYCQNNRLTGSIPENFWSVGLQYADLSNNPNMNTTLTASMGAESQFSQLSLSSCGLHGVFPQGLVLNWPELQSLQMSDNYLTGPLPDCNITEISISTLDLASNSFTGTIPTCYGNITDLSILRLGGNCLEGPLPDTLIQCQQLSTIDVTGNYLSGVIPNLVHPQSMLQFVALGDNCFVSPPIPLYYSLAGATGIDLIYVDFSDVDMGGLDMKHALSIMFGTTSCTGQTLSLAISTLYMPNCNLTGSIPGFAFCLLPQLTTLSFANNQLSGSIPKVPMPFFLQTLDLSNNQLTGALPMALGAAFRTGLYDVSLQGNDLRGVNGSLPGYLTYSWDYQIDNTTGNYACPGIINYDGSSEVTMDAAFYDFDFCNCTQNYHGAVATGCQPNSILCQPGAPDCVDNSVVANRAVTIAVGFAPSPNNSAVSAFLSCAPIGSQTQSNGCTGTCACTISNTNVISCDGCDVCSPGYVGRLCGLCDTGYFHLYNLCLTCESAAGSSSWVAIFCAVFFVVTALAVAGCLNELDMTPRVRLLKSLPSYLTGSSRRSSGRSSNGTIPIGLTLNNSDTASSVYDSGTYNSVGSGSTAPQDDGGVCGRKGNGLGIVIFITVLDVSVITVVVLFHQVALWEIQLLTLVGVNSVLFVVVWQQMGYRRARAEKMPANRDAPIVATVAEESSMDKGLLKTFLFYLQVSFALLPLSVLSVPAQTMNSGVGASSVGPTVQITNPTVVKEIFDALQMVVQLRPSGMDCILDVPLENKYAVKLAIMMCLPAMFAVVAGVMYAFRYTILARDDKFEKHKQFLMGRAVSTVLFLFYFTIFSLLTNALTILNCDPDPTPGYETISWVVTMPYIQCYWSNAWQYAAMAAFIPLSFYALCIIVVMRHLHRNRKLLHEPVEIARYGFLYTSYRPHLWWFEAVTFTRRTAIAVLLATISTASPFRQQLLMTVLVFALFIQVQMQPYRSPLANRMEAASLIVMSLSYLGTTTVEQSDSTLYEYLGINSLRMCIIIANGIFILVFLMALSAKFLKKTWRRYCRPTKRKGPTDLDRAALLQPSTEVAVYGTNDLQSIDERLKDLDANMVVLRAQLQAAEEEKERLERSRGAASIRESA